VTGLEGAGVAGELLSWIGLGLGLPLLLVGLALRSTERALVPTEIVIVRGSPEPLARWFADDDFPERPLYPAERPHYAGRDVCTGYISRRDPTLIRLEPHRPATGIYLTLGGTLTVIGLVGLALSIIPTVLA
jgi:hypothetical protein